MTVSYITLRKAKLRPLGVAFGAILNRFRRGTSERQSVVNDYPESVGAAVLLLKELMPDDEQAAISAMAEDHLIKLHHGLGQWVRNHLGLWGENPVLLAATGEQTADDASDAIIRAFWSALRAELPKIH